MEKIERVKVLMKVLIENGFCRNQAEFGERLGYTNKSSFSQVVNGRVPFPKSFTSKLLHAFPAVNAEWLNSETGEMLLENAPSVSSVAASHSGGVGGNAENLLITELRQELEAYKKREAKYLEQINDLISILKNQ